MNKKIIAVISLIIIIVLITGFLSKKKYDSLLAATSEGLTLGKTYGKIISQSNCMMGLKMKYASCTTTDCELSATGYIAGCMQEAKKDAFCNEVPNIKDTNKAIEWANKTCAEYDLGKEKCPKYIHKFVNTCTEQKESRKITKGELFESGLKKGFKKSAD